MKFKDIKVSLAQKAAYPLTSPRSPGTSIEGSALRPPNYGIDLLDKGQYTAKMEQAKKSTGLPDNLKTAIETLSGISMDDVNVNYNSAQPAQDVALAYTEGANIHMGPGQEQHLAHEAWHVVQQKQGRVTPSSQMKGFTSNTDSKLEKEADLMGLKAETLAKIEGGLPDTNQALHSPNLSGRSASLVQRNLTQPAIRQFNNGDGPKAIQEQMSSSEVQALVEGKDLDSLAGTDPQQPLKLLGQGANKRAYLVKNQNWVVLAAPPGVEYKTWRGVANEVSQLLVLKAAEIVTPDFGEPGVKAEPVKGPDLLNLNDPTTIGPAAPYIFKVLAFGGQECRAFIESVVKGIEMPTAIARKTRPEGASRPEDFGPLVADWLKKNDSSVELYETAIADLKKIQALFASGTNIPDFQVVFEYASGHVVTIDPGDPLESGDTLEKHKRWVAGWLKILGIEKSNRLRKNRTGLTRPSVKGNLTGGLQMEEEVPPSRPTWMTRLAQKEPRFSQPTRPEPQPQEPRPALKPVARPNFTVKNPPIASRTESEPKTVAGGNIPQGFTEVNPPEGTGFNAVYARRIYRPDKPIDVPGSSYNYILPNQQHVDPKIVNAKLEAWGESGPPSTPVVPLIIDRKSGKLMIGGDGHHTFVACLKAGFAVQLELKKTPFATNATDWTYCTYKAFSLNPAAKTGTKYATSSRAL
jgi:hypothetical protein